MSEVLLASPYHQPLDPAESALGRPFPPLGVLVSAAELRSLGADVAVYDATLAPAPELFVEALRGHKPGRVAIVSDPHSVPVKMCTRVQREATLTMVRSAKEQGADVLVAGPDPTDHPEPYRLAGADFVVTGEHDRALLAWARGESVDPARTPPRTDLDALPAPAWGDVDLPAYAARWRKRHGRWELPVSTARGCPYRCNWCAKPTWGRSYHTCTPDRAAELVATARHHGADGVWFTDDIFAVKPAWLRAYRVAAGPDPLPFRCNTRADLVRDGAYVEDLAAAGCTEVWMGAESGSDRVLAAMDKDQTLHDVETAVSRLRRVGIRACFFLQLGYPGETAADVGATLDMVRRLRPDELGISVTYPLPGTVLHERVREGMTHEQWDHAMANEVLFAGAYPQPYYDAVREVIRAEHAWLTFAPALTPRGARRAALLPYHAARWPIHRAKMAWYALRN